MFRSVKRLNRAMWWKGTTALFPDYYDETTWLPWWKIPLENPGNAISKTLNFKMPLAASPLKSLCLWCEFQTHLLLIVSLLLKNFLIYYTCQVEKYVSDIPPVMSILTELQLSLFLIISL